MYILFIYIMYALSFCTNRCSFLKTMGNGPYIAPRRRHSMLYFIATITLRPKSIAVAQLFSQTINNLTFIYIITITKRIISYIFLLQEKNDFLENTPTIFL